MEGNLHSSLNTICRVVSCCAGVVFSYNGGAHGEENAHLFTTRCCQPLHLSSDNDSLWPSDKLIVGQSVKFILTT